MNSCDKPDDLSLSDQSKKYPNRNIKERLNLHVKRRLQENPTIEQTGTSPNSLSSFGAGCASSQKRGGSSERGGSISQGGRGGKKFRNSKHLTLSVSSASSTCPDDECSRDGSSSCADLNRDKVQSPDILTTVLNHKKLSLFHDPEVMKFLEEIVRVIGKKTEDSACT